MTTWDIKQTHNLIHKRFCDEQLKLARRSIQSLFDRQNYTQYHYQEIVALFDAFQVEHLARTTSILTLVGKEQRELDDFILKIGAHGLACLHCLHSITDILAHAIYFSLGLNLEPKPLSERGISLESVTTKLRLDTKFLSILNRLENYTQSAAYKHLAAASNLSKHRSVVSSSLNEDWSGSSAERHSLQFVAFNYLGAQFPARTIQAVLQPVFENVGAVIVDTGNEFNTLLSAGAP